MPYNNSPMQAGCGSPAKKYGPVHMKPNLGPNKMMGPLKKMQQPPLLAKCGSKRYK